MSAGILTFSVPKQLSFYLVGIVVPVTYLFIRKTVSRSTEKIVRFAEERNGIRMDE